MQLNTKFRKKSLSGVAIAMLLAGTANAADHRDSFATDALSEGDFTDVISFVDPANSNNVILMGLVNPFLQPNELPSGRLSDEYLYQFKIDNGGSPAEDLVVQVEASGVGGEARSLQKYVVRMGVPTVTGPLNTRLPATATTLCDSGAAGVFNGNANSAPRQDYFVPGGAAVPTSTASTGVRCFVGTTDDSFQTDVAQAVFRIGLNPGLAPNAINHSQDVFRGFVSTPFGPLRGRPIRLDGSSGVDGFGGFNATALVVSLPKTLIQGAQGIRDIRTNTRNRDLVGIWGTVSRPTRETFDGFVSEQEFDNNSSNTFAQFERMGQELTNTVFGFAPLPLNRTPLRVNDVNAVLPGFIQGPDRAITTAEVKDLLNATGPETDAALFGRLIPGSLTAITTPGAPNNTIAGRALLLTALGVTTPGISGVPLLLPQIGLSGSTNPNLLQDLIMPDYLRLNLAQATDGIRAGAATSGNNSATLSVAKWGLQNGRRPADDVTDILLRLCRELCDVAFPSTLIINGLPAVVNPLNGVIGSTAGLIPGAGPSGPTTGRFPVDCTNLNVSLSNPQIVVPCADARVFAVLQGTDFIEKSPLDIMNVANQVSPERALEPSFPYLGLANAVPGQPNTANFPNQDGVPLIP